jgi:hypothetical protein
MCSARFFPRISTHFLRAPLAAWKDLDAMLHCETAGGEAGKCTHYRCGIMTNSCGDVPLGSGSPPAQTDSTLHNVRVRAKSVLDGSTTLLVAKFTLCPEESLKSVLYAHEPQDRRWNPQ